MSLTEEQIQILDHTLNRAANRTFCGDSAEMQELCKMGLMKGVGRTGFCPDPFFVITEKGIAALSGVKTPSGTEESVAFCNWLEEAGSDIDKREGEHTTVWLRRVAYMAWMASCLKALNLSYAEEEQRANDRVRASSASLVGMARRKTVFWRIVSAALAVVALWLYLM